MFCTHLTRNQLLCAVQSMSQNFVNMPIGNGEIITYIYFVALILLSLSLSLSLSLPLLHTLTLSLYISHSSVKPPSLSHHYFDFLVSSELIFFRGGGHFVLAQTNEPMNEPKSPSTEIHF